MFGKHTVHLSVGGFIIRLFSNRNISLDVGYSHFICEGKKNPDIQVECLEGVPDGILTGAKQVFKAANAEKTFYSIYRNGTNLVFAIYNQENQNEIQQFAQLDETLTHWKVWMKMSDNKLESLKYPMGPIILHYLTLHFEAVLMHASCVFDGEKGRLFSGFSGAGKSTISKLWAEAGNQIINDDRVIIRREETGYFVYNTPMYYEDVSKKATLNAVYLISHSPVNQLKKRNGASAVSGIMAFSIQHNFDSRFISHHLDFFSRLCTEVPVYDLGFVPDDGVIDFIKEKTQ